MNIHFRGLTLIDAAKPGTVQNQMEKEDRKHSVGLATCDGNLGMVVWGEDAVDLLKKVGIEVSEGDAKQVNDAKIVEGFQQKYGENWGVKFRDITWWYGLLLKEIGNPGINIKKTHKNPGAWD